MKKYLTATIYPYTLILFLFISACKKDNPDTGDGNTRQTSTTDRVALTNDSIFLYAKEIYYWNENLPSYDTYNPRQYVQGSTDLDNYTSNVLGIAQYSTSKYDVATNDNGEEYTKFSYIEDVSDQSGETAGIRNLTNAVNLQDEGNDIGIYFVSAVGSNTNYELFIKAVYPGSPAAQAGLTRGATITKIGSEAIGDNFDGEVDVINNQLLDDPSSVYLEGTKVDGSSYQVTLTKRKYDSSPIYKTKVITRNGKKIGYLAYARFSNLDDTRDTLDAIFNDFAGQNVEDLIIDLRYNGGGYVETAEHIANLIAPSGTMGTMYIEYYNQTMQNGQAAILENQPVRNANGDIVGTGTYADEQYDVEHNTREFAKAGSLTGVKNVVFLVTNNTASASELLINTIRGIDGVDVQLVGTTTYGKPVGFFPIRLEGKYDLYLALFSTKNGKEQGDYYDGFTPDGTGDQGIPGTLMLDNFGQDMDTFSSEYDFGDEREDYLAEALNLLAPTSLSTSSSRVMSIRGVSTKTSSLSLKRNLGKVKEFKGMIDNRSRQH